MRVAVNFERFAFKYDEAQLREAPRLVLHTDDPRLGPDNMPYAVVPLGRSTADVPSGPDARALFVTCMALTRTDAGAEVLNTCGRAEFPALGTDPASADLVAHEVRRGASPPFNPPGGFAPLQPPRGVRPQRASFGGRGGGG